MWHILLSSPELMGFFVFYMIAVAAALIFATIARDCEPTRSDGPPPPQGDYQVFWSPDPRWPRVESDRRFWPVQDSCCVDSDRRLWPVQHWSSTVYARMFADAFQRIRL